MWGIRKLTAAVLLGLAGTAIAFAQTAQLPQSTASDGFAPAPESPPLFNYTFGVGAGHTDNLFRTSTDTVSQDLLQPTFNFTFNKQGSTLKAQIAGLLDYTDYIQGDVGNEFRGQLTGQMNWIVSPQRLNFELQDYSSVEPVNTRLANAPANQQQVNVFIAGPTLSFRLGSDSTWNGEADLRYINTTASKTKDFNSQRGFVAARLIRDLDVTSHLSINLEGASVSFDNVNPTVTASRYDEYNLYARYQSRLAHVDLDLTLGASRVNFSRRWPDHSGTFARASTTWRLDAHDTLQLTGANQLADATADLTQPPALTSDQLTNPTVVVGRTVISPAVFRDRAIRLSYIYQGPRVGVTLSPYYTQLRQLNGIELSQNGFGGIIDITYMLTPLMTLGADLGDQTTQYTSDNSRDRDHTATVNLTRQFTSHWSWSLAFSHDQRHSSRPGFGYTENEVFAFLYYRR
jgi:hypothetical protein